MSIKRMAMITGAVLLGAGCMPVGNYHSARTLASGESSLGITFSSTTYTEPESGDSLTIPGIIPEISYHIGLDDNLEVGGRVAPGFLYGEVDGKFRFLRSERLHLAVAPALGQFAVGIRVTTVRMPLVMTYELHPKIAFNASISGAGWLVHDAGGSDSPFPSDDKVLETGGFSLGLEFTGETAFFRPSVEYTTAVFKTANSAERFQLAAFVMHFGMVQGRELKKLNEMDEKLDRIEKNTMSWANRWKPVASASE